MNILFGLKGFDWVIRRTLCVFILLSQGIRAIFQLFESFDSTTFYVALIAETLADVKAFSVIMLVLLVYFGSAMYMLQLNALLNEESVIV